MGVRGTLFTVVLTPTGVQVNLLEGELEGTTAYESIILHAGQTLVVKEDGSAEAQPLQVEMLDAFTLQTIRDNAEMLMQIGTIHQNELRTIDRLITARQAEAAANEQARLYAVEAVLAEEAAVEEYTPETYTPTGDSNYEPSTGDTPREAPAAPVIEADDDGEYEEYIDSQGRVRRRWRWRRSR
jgi:hypothetical protein